MLILTNLTELTKAYLAGIFDGEGGISMIVQEGTNNWNRIEVQVSQNDKSFLEPLKEYYGGAIHYTGKGKTCSSWKIVNRAAVSFLTDIAPYVVMKKEEVSIALELCKVVPENPGIRLEMKEQILRAKLEEMLYAALERRRSKY